MTRLRYTLLGDGTSDRMLQYPIRWALASRNVALEQESWADFTHVKTRPASLSERVALALELYPADLLFVHRDAEAVPWADRIREIREAVTHPHVAIVPVRMTEAWFLHDEDAIRRASGNVNGRVPLELPNPKRVESIADPKRTLFDLLRTASEKRGRRLSQLDRELGKMRARVGELVRDFEALRAAPAFQEFLLELDLALERFTKD
ncbi:MAG: hypothetical protein KF901_25560 [Myxococcales bacterium]|nr:hypothetical protein [Myxococcales bacterium]